jgi:hypothetical protein
MATQVILPRLVVFLFADSKKAFLLNGYGTLLVPFGVF